MKKILSLFLVLASAQAFATRARYQALGSSFHLVDTQSEFSSPYHLFSIKDFASVESGLTNGTNANNGAEAITKFSLNDNSKLLVALGHKDETVQTQRTFMSTVIGGTAFVTEQNPVEVMYGFKSGDSIWGVGAYYSEMKDKVNNFNEQTTGLRVGASHGDFKWKVNLGLNNKAENTTNGTFKNQPYGNLGLRYNMAAHRFGLDYTMWTAKRDNAAGVEANSYDFQNIKFQYINTTQTDGNDFFYGAGVDSITLKDKISGNKLTRLAVPLIVGFEHAATETFTVRGSIKQVLWAQSKDDIGLPTGSVDGAYGGAVSEFNGVPNNTIVAMGMGWNLSKQVTIDGTLAGLTGATATQTVNQSNLFALAGATYFF